MMMAMTTRTRTGRRGQHIGPCRYCRQDVLWLTNVTTGKVAPIDPLPTPGGNVAVDRLPGGALAGTYTVLAGADRDAADPTTADLDAQPTLRLNHWVTCEARQPMTPAQRYQPPPDDVVIEDPPDGYEELL